MPASRPPASRSVHRLRPRLPYVAPAFTYPHSTRCSVIGGYVYRGTAVPAARGRYFFGDFCDGSISSFRAGAKGKAGAAVELPGRIANLSSFGVDGRGELYAVSLDGGLYRLSP